MVQGRRQRPVRAMFCGRRRRLVGLTAARRAGQDRQGCARDLEAHRRSCQEPLFQRGAVKPLYTATKHLNRRKPLSNEYVFAYRLKRLLNRCKPWSNEPMFGFFVDLNLKAVGASRVSSSPARGKASGTAAGAPKMAHRVAGFEFAWLPKLLKPPHP